MLSWHLILLLGLIVGLSVRLLLLQPLLNHLMVLNSAPFLALLTNKLVKDPTATTSAPTPVLTSAALNARKAGIAPSTAPLMPLKAAPIPLPVFFALLSTFFKSLPNPPSAPLALASFDLNSYYLFLLCHSSSRFNVFIPSFNVVGCLYLPFAILMFSVSPFTSGSSCSISFIIILCLKVQNRFYQLANLWLNCLSCTYVGLLQQHHSAVC